MKGMIFLIGCMSMLIGVLNKSHLLALVLFIFWLQILRKC